MGAVNVVAVAVVVVGVAYVVVDNGGRKRNRTVNAIVVWGCRYSMLWLCPNSDTDAVRTIALLVALWQ